MPNASVKPARLSIRWLPSALKSFSSTISRIDEQDAQAADLVIQRVERALAILSTRPGIGTPAATAGKRRFPVPDTGHTIEYRVVKGELRVTRWVRHTRRHSGH